MKAHASQNSSTVAPLISLPAQADRRNCCIHKITEQQSLSELLHLCLNSKDEIAWIEFVRRFQPLISATIQRCIRSRWSRPHSGLVEDLVQNTYLKLCADNFRALREFDLKHEYALEGFLKVVASNVAQDYLRSSLCQKRGSGKGEDDIEKFSPTIGIFDRFVMTMEREILVRQIQQQLDRHAANSHFKRDCEIFWLYYRYGLTAQAISRLPEIELNVKGVESVLFRLIRLLKAKLGSSA